LTSTATPGVCGAPVAQVGIEGDEARLHGSRV
jgi:hypothetical protein